MGFTELWTIIAIVLKLCGIGAFAKWDFIAWPWHWSCLCIELWSLILYLAIVLCIVAWMLIKYILTQRR